jgi:SH2 domain
MAFLCLVYKLQQEAPKPIGVPCRNKEVPSSALANIFGAEFHGSVSHSKAVKLLTEDGMYLVRNSSDGQQTLSMR